ncbi:hypothetical protein ACFLR7_00220 [Acidobacteriota bacterium]
MHLNRNEASSRAKARVMASLSISYDGLTLYYSSCLRESTGLAREARMVWDRMAARPAVSAPRTLRMQISLILTRAVFDLVIVGCVRE